MITAEKYMGNALTGFVPETKYASRPCEFCEMAHGHERHCIVFDLPVAPDKSFDEFVDELSADLDVQEVIAHTIVSPEVEAQCREELRLAERSWYAVSRL